MQNLLPTHFIVTVMLSVMLQDMAFTTIEIGCHRQLAEMHISVARDMVFRHDIAFITKAFVRRFGVLSLLMLFSLCFVYLNCFMSDTDTLLLTFSRVMNCCMLFVACPLVRCVYCFLSFSFFHVPCVRFQ